MDAEISSESSTRSEAVDVDQILEQLSPARLSMVILDACRDNPFGGLAGGDQKGLSQMDAPQAEPILRSIAALARGIGAIREANARAVASARGAQLTIVEAHNLPVGDAVVGWGRWRLTPPGGVVATPAPVTSPESRPVDAPPAADANTRTAPLAQRVPYSDEAYARMSKPGAATVVAAAPDGKPDIKPETKPDAKPDAKPEAPRADGEVDWSWPTEGKVIGNFNDSTNKGIVISGKRGQAVNASAGGRVIFSGTGIRGLGKLVVIRHNANYLSVYAHNDNLLVKEGQTVRKGQRIADMGSSDADQVKLHFEIRRQGKPVDPAKLLPGT